VPPNVITPIGASAFNPDILGVSSLDLAFITYCFRFAPFAVNCLFSGISGWKNPPPPPNTRPAAAAAPGAP